MEKPEKLNTIQAADILGIKPSTLRIWRTQGKGPTYEKIGALVYYYPATLRSWMAAQVRTSTSQKAPCAASA